MKVYQCLCDKLKPDFKANFSRFTIQIYNSMTTEETSI